MPRPTWHEVFMNQLTSLSMRSCCLKIQTAALIAIGRRVISFGYNGTFSKQIECNAYWRHYYGELVTECSFNQWLESDDFKNMHREWSKHNEVHAEANALSMIAKYDITDDHVMYTLYSPCDACTKTILLYGIKHVYYKKEYARGSNALNRLRAAGIIVTKI